MKIRYYFIILCSFLYCIDLEIDQSFGTINHEDNIYENPFLGGFNKPKVQWIDWNNDNSSDLFLLDEDGHIKYYLNNINDDGSYSLKLVSTNFLEICNILWFYIHDFDNDNEYEIITSDPINNQYMKYYDIINNELVDRGNIVNNNSDLIVIDQVMVPCFADIDADGDLDLFSGNVVGTINYYENLEFVVDKPVFNTIDSYWQEIYIVGSSLNQRHGASAINFIDLDDDNDLDLSWGDYFQQSLYIIWNEGDVYNPQMNNENFLTQFPIEDPVFTAGLNMPSFTDIDQDGDMDLFITTLSGAYGYQLINNFIFYEKNDGTFINKTSNFINTIDLLSDVNPTFVDIDNDADLDLFIGTDFDPSSFPWIGKIVFYENIGYDNNNHPIWQKNNSDFLNENIGNNLYPEFIDIDFDGDFDLFVGEYNGELHYFENNGSPNIYNFIYQGKIDSIDNAGYSAPEFVDIDNDDDFDLLLGDISGFIFLYENIGDKYEFNFNLINESFGNINVGSRSSILSVDLDNDLDIDFILGSGNSNILYFENIGDQINNIYDFSDYYTFPVVGLNTSLDYYNSNNKRGFLSGTSAGGFYYMPLDSLIAGDVTQDGIANILDIVYIVGLIVNNSPYENNADLNNDELVDIVDIVTLVNIIIN